MEVTRKFQFKTAPRPKNTSILRNNSTFNLMKRFSSLNFKASDPPKNTSNLIKRLSSLDVKASRPPKKNMEHFQRNVLDDLGHCPRRGTRSNLPKPATNVLKDWLVCNWYDPYPSDDEKEELAHMTGLRLGQVNNWMINGRRRLLPGICLKYGLDITQCKIAKRGGNRGSDLRNRTRELDGRPDSYAKWDPLPRESLSAYLGRFSMSFQDLDSSTDVTYKVVLTFPDLPGDPVMLDYLADVMLVNEEWEKQPNNEGLSRHELLRRRGLGERLVPCSP